MSKVIKQNDSLNQGRKYVIPAPKLKPKVDLSKQEEEQEESNLDRKRREIENELENLEKSKKDFEANKDKAIIEARERAEEIVKEAEDMAFSKVKQSKAQAQVEYDKLKAEAEKIIQDAKYEAEKIIEDANQQSQNIIDENTQKGHDEGYKTGYDEGFNEAERLISRLHVVVSEIVNKRTEIIEGTEYQVISLVMLIVKKVIKVITENQKTVIVNNVIEALKKVKNTRKIIIRVNLDDLEMASRNKAQFIELVEGLESIELVEDTTVDKGGCIIQTDFGEIDARISLQLKEIEDKILDLVPVKRKLLGDDED